MTWCSSQAARMASMSAIESGLEMLTPRISAPQPAPEGSTRNVIAVSSERQFQINRPRNRIESIRRSWLEAHRCVQGLSLLHSRQRIQYQLAISTQLSYGNDGFGQSPSEALPAR